MKRLLFAVVLGGFALAAAALAQDTTRYAEGGITFEYPKGWKASTEKPGGVASVTVQNDKGTQAIIQVHPATADPKTVRSEMENVFRKAFEGKLVKGSQKAAKRKIAGAQQEGVAMDFEVAKDIPIHFEFFAFPLAAKKPVVSVVFQHGEFDAAAAKKGFDLIAGSLAVPETAKKPRENWVPAVELTDKAGKWLLKEAKVGTKMLSDRDYLLSALPKEIAGGTYIMRTSGEYGRWLPDGALKAKKDGTVYAIIRLKYLGKETFDELAEEQLKKDGWSAVEGKVATTFPAGEKWEWKAYMKGIKEGAVMLQLEHLSWDTKTGVLFVVK